MVKPIGGGIRMGNRGNRGNAGGNVQMCELFDVLYIRAQQVKATIRTFPHLHTNHILINST